MWITNMIDGTVSVLAASDGAVVGTYLTGGYPAGVAFDGANVWVMNSEDSTVTKFDAATRHVLATYPTTTGGDVAVSDGTYLWATGGSTQVQRLSLASGESFGSYAYHTDVVAFDGSDIWLGTSDGLTLLDSTDGSQAAQYALAYTPAALAWDGHAMWAVNGPGNSVSQVAPDGTVLGTYPVGTNPYAATVANGYVWIYSAGTVTALTY
jgi:hypothetical protein